jgi:DNA repair photolyase
MMHDKPARGILSAANGMNLYRGCTHGCIYFDSRSHCYQINHDFEDVEVKVNAPQLLEEALRRKREKCMIGTGSMTDPYLHCEAQRQLTRRCLEIIERRGFGLAIQTKSTLILRDLNLLQRIHEKARCVVQTTLTTADEALCRVLEPRVSTTAERVAMLETMRDRGIPTVVWLCPILPYINDTEENLRALLEDCIRAKVAGILCFGMGLTLRAGSREYFYRQLDAHFPGLKQRYQREYGSQYIIKSPRNDELMENFHTQCDRHGILHDNDEVFRYLRKWEPQEQQTTLF